jgi:hypothetical protein
MRRSRFPQELPSPPPRYRRITPVASALVVVLGAILAGVFWTIRHDTTSSGDVRGDRSQWARASDDRHLPVLSILSTRVHQSESGDIWYVDGEVQNLTTNPLTNVQAAVSWFDTADVLITKVVALVDLERLPPGHVAGYRTSTRTVKGMARFEVQLESERGQPLLTRGDRKGSINASPVDHGDDIVPTSGTVAGKPAPPP